MRGQADVAGGRDASHDRAPFAVGEYAPPDDRGKKACGRDDRPWRRRGQRHERGVESGGEAPFIDEDGGHADVLRSRAAGTPSPGNRNSQPAQPEPPARRGSRNEG